MSKKFHLGWFSNFMTDEWNDPLSSAGGNPWSGDFYIEFAKALERACFDYLLLEDTLMVSEVYGGSNKAALNGAVHVPKNDPMPLAAVLASHTRHLGIVATMSTMSYHPFTLARLASTTDAIAQGRFGWNIVTSAEDLAARNYGLDSMPPHDTRYDIADEYVDCVSQLFGSWDKDAIVMDRDRGVYVDETKVRPINFKGEYYSSRGPLNTAPLPWGRPVYVQAGSSEKGRDFAARHADSIITGGEGIKSMKTFRDDVRARAAKFGRDPDEVKILFLLAPVLGETEAEARAYNDRRINEESFIRRRLTLLSGITEIDFSKFDLDKPLPPDLATNGESSALRRFAQQHGTGKSLRQILVEGAGKAGTIDMVGTPDQIAEYMGRVMEEVGGDGFLLRHPFNLISRRYIAEITEGLVPALQRRGLVRTRYAGTTLRDSLREF